MILPWYTEFWLAESLDIAGKIKRFVPGEIMCACALVSSKKCQQYSGHAKCFLTSSHDAKVPFGIEVP